MMLKQPNIMRSISPNILLFKVVGFWPCGNKFVYQKYSFLVIFLMVLYNASQVMYIVDNIDDYVEVSATAYNLLSTIGAVIKASIFLKKYHHIERVTALLKSELFRPLNDAQIRILNKGISLSRFIFFFFFIMADVTILLWTTFPMMGRQRRLPSNAWFPYDYLSSKYFVITYFCQSILVVYHALSNVSMDTLFAMLMVQISTQCELLSNTIINISKFAADDNDNEGINNTYGDNNNRVDRLNDKLRICVLHHKLIIE